MWVLKERKRPKKVSANKEKILDVAEELFSLYGYYGVAVRDVTHAAGVDVALAHYHFGTKVELLNRVVERRAAEYCGAFNTAMDAMEANAADGTPSVEAIIDALISPAFERMESGDTGWRNYVRLIATLNHLRQEEYFLKSVHEYYYPIVARAIGYLKKALPFRDEQDIYWSFYFYTSSISNILAENQMLEHLSQGQLHAPSYAKIRDEMISFFIAGFSRLKSPTG